MKGAFSSYMEVASVEVSELHELTLQVLRHMYQDLITGRTNEVQFSQDLNAGHIIDQVACLARDSGLWQPKQPIRTKELAELGAAFPEDDAVSVRAVLWQFVGVGVLVPRSMLDARNQFFTLSSYGRQILSEAKESPYDPTGFLKRLEVDAPRLESATLGFVAEALGCYLSRHHRAAAVMIGLASENEILKLSDIYGDSLDGATKQRFGSGIDQKRSLKEKFQYLYERLRQEKLPVEGQEIDTWLQGIFQIIRLHRNDAGHLLAHKPTREAVYANLNLFLTYARNLSRLKEYLSAKAQNAP